MRIDYDCQIQYIDLSENDFKEKILNAFQDQYFGKHSSFNKDKKRFLV